jgi:hypothetical protein
MMAILFVDLEFAQIYETDLGTGVIYGGCRHGGKTYRTSVSSNIITIHPPEPTSEQEEKIKPLVAQWNRAKVQKNKNLMRDIERKIECIRGY